jgi:hypothetical protein
MKFFAPLINLAVVHCDRGDLVQAVQLDQRALQRDQGENTRGRSTPAWPRHATASLLSLQPNVISTRLSRLNRAPTRSLNATSPSI